MRIAHVITRMIVGGAQENTLFTCEDLVREHGDDVLLITGPAIGPEGDLLTQGGEEDVPVPMCPRCGGRSIRGEIFRATLRSSESARL